MLDELYGFDVPERFREVTGRHQQHVAQLVERLRSTGMDDSLVELSIDRLMASYRSELLIAIKGMGAPHGD